MRLNEIYQAHQGGIAFFLIYIREAHAANGWQTPQNLYEEIIYDEPTPADERAAVGQACQINLGLTIPMLLDSIDNDVEQKYITSPIRLFVIDKGGIITFNGAPGPRGFDPDAWEEAIKERIAAG